MGGGGSVRDMSTLGEQCVAKVGDVAKQLLIILSTEKGLKLKKRLPVTNATIQVLVLQVILELK